MLFWTSRDYTVTAPEWDGQVRGIAYNPSHIFSQTENMNIAPERITADLAQLSKITSHLRTYTVDGGMDKVPDIARHYGMTVSMGIWISADLDKNEEQIALGIRTALANRRSIDRVIVGNETQTFGSVSPDQLNDYIRRVRMALPARIKVTTAEPWSTWMMTPEIGQNVDLIFVHLLPYWENVDIRGALKSSEGFYNHVQAEFPDKQIVVGEAGWPSEGRTRGRAEASPANEGYFLRAFVQFAMEKGWDYYLFEAYDQPWKDANEGVAGPLLGPVRCRRPAQIRLHRPDPRLPGMARLCPDGGGAEPALGPAGAGPHAPGAPVRLSDDGRHDRAGFDRPAHADRRDGAGICRSHRCGGNDRNVAAGAARLRGDPDRGHRDGGEPVARRAARGPGRHSRKAPPRVSIHVPTYNEPPQMVIETLNALARLDYENFEVIVLDNNTPDPQAAWTPVAEHCRKLGPAFRFYHFDGIKGFKGGALNKALALTDPGASYVAVIDSDYQVQPFLAPARRALFCVAQHRAGAGACRIIATATRTCSRPWPIEEYRGFFHIGMVERNERNAIIQHGTMTIVRKDALEEVDGWSEWCITEDTELGLKLFEAGYEAAYVPQSMGLGPDARYIGSLHDSNVTGGSMAPCRCSSAMPAPFSSAARRSAGRSAISSFPAGCPGSRTGWVWW